MFDLVDLLKTDSVKEAHEEKITTVLFQQTAECRNLVEEAYRFEGIMSPVVVNNNEESIREHVRASAIEIVIVELNNSSNVTQDMERISHLLPNEASVIVIGSEDSISTIRNLKDMGFYYLFWPITKQELIDFVRNVHENRQRKAGLGKNRDAKKVAFWGSKGGVGTTLLASEVAHLLANEKDSKCLIVDHDYLGGNLDIFMGMKGYGKKPLQTGTLSANLDITYAQSLVSKQSDMLSVLGVDSNDISEEELKSYTRALSSQLAKENNFIIEDLSRGGCSKPDAEYLSKHCQIIILIVEPTVSSLRETVKFITQMEELNCRSRYIVVLNHPRPEQSATITKKEIEKYLNQPIDVVLPYEQSAGEQLILGKKLSEGNLKIRQGINEITSLLLGESVTVNPSWFQRLMSKRSC